MDCLFNSLPAFAFSLLAQATEAVELPPSFAGISLKQWIVMAVTIAVIAVPMYLGSVFAKALRMPDYASRISWVLFAVIASATVLSFYKLRLGVDLRGGTILTYEIDPSVGIVSKSDASSEGELGDRKEKIDSSALVTSLVKRINPAGTQEIVVRPYGENQLEIIVPAVDQREVEEIKTKISEAGILRFAIIANTRDHSPLIDQVSALNDDPGTTKQKRLVKSILDVDGKTVRGFWAMVDREKPTGDGTGVAPLRVDVTRSIIRNAADGRLIQLPIDVNDETKLATWMAKEKIENIQVLMAVDPEFIVTGEDLAFASTGFDPKGGPCVRFKLNDQGAGRFLALTQTYSPDGQFMRQLGIVLDDKLLSAPVIRSAIQGDGVINGKFTTEEVKSLVDILQAGQLPAALTKQPIAENQIDATLGADTINKGLWATGWALLAVLVFMLFYYRFTGVIACVVLVLNLVMTLALMILISQPLTLPGIAGLVLTVGMSVDANVLIFERIREELAKGAAARMAIRNGFARATTTIVDANLTTLITAIVLYAIGTDQIRGFAVTLILGILFSMFSAIYVSRTFLDIAERKGYLSLAMNNSVATLRDSLTAGKGFDFMGNSKLAFGISIALMLAGLGAILARGSSIFDIDFSGGSSVTFRVGEPTTTEAIRAVVSKILTTDDKNSTIDYTVNNVSVENAPKKTVFKIDTSIADVDQLKAKISEGFKAEKELKLVTYELDITPSADGKTSQHVSSPSAVRLAAFYAQDEATATKPADETATEPANPVTETDKPATESPVAAPPALDVTPPVSTATENTTAEVKPEDATVKPSATEVVSRSRLKLAIKGSTDKADMNAKTLIANILKAATAAGVQLDESSITLEPFGDGAEAWSPQSDLRFSEWEVGLPLEFGPGDEIMKKLELSLSDVPVWISSSSVGSRVAGGMVSRALFALFGSLLAIIAYIWFRFNRVVYGVAAVAALVHDVLITIGAIAVSFWLAQFLGFMLVDQFKISLTVVAALLTVIGYSLNDTIVVFDRIRETKGKSLRLTSDMINSSINSTLSRTLLTSLTTLLVVVVLYFFGGSGIHAFAFSLVIGITIGTYSSIFVASPVLLWLAQKYQPAARQN